MVVALRVGQWTLAQVHRLPEDGNKYELVRGELFVTPPPSELHETVAAKLHAVLSRYVETNGLGLVYRPRAVMRYRGSEVEPDLMVRRELEHRSGNDSDWDRMPVPILVVEIASPFTRRRDLVSKRELYLEAGVAEYWIVDCDERSVRVVLSGQPDVLVTQTVEWNPPGARAPLRFDVVSIF